LSIRNSAAKSVALIIVLTLAGKLLGFFREVLIAAKFGSGFESDAFFIALSATALITSLVQKAIKTTTIPVLFEVEAQEGKEGKRLHTSNLFNIVLLIALGLVIVGWVTAPWVLKVLAHGFEREQFDLAVVLMRIGMPVVIFSCATGVFRAYLQSEMRFLEFAASTVPFNFVFIFFLLFLSSIFGIKGLMVASVLAVASQLLIQIPGLVRTGYKFNHVLNIKDKYITKVLALTPPVFISVAIRDVNVIINKSLASFLIIGSISALNYANRLTRLVSGVFIYAITTVLYPILSKEANKDSYDGLKNVLTRGINVILLITVPATVGMIILAKPIVKVAFERGAFDAVATTMTSGALIFYSLGLVGMAMTSLLNNAYYSLQDTRTPMLYGLVSVGINICTNLVLIRFIAHMGLALGTSIAATVAAVLLLTGLRKKIGSLGGMRIISCGIKTLVASAAMGITAYISYGFLDSSILGDSFILELSALLGAVTLAVVVYCVMVIVLKIDEVFWVLNLGKQQLQKRGIHIPFQ